MIYLLYTIHVILCMFLILVVLLQQGKGADLSVFGGGATMTAFGARSATTLLHRLTVGGFVGFVLTTLAIAYVKGNVEGGSLMKGVESAPAAVEAPAEPTPAVEGSTTEATPAEAAPVEAAPVEAAPDPEPTATPVTEPPAAAGDATETPGGGGS